MKAHHEMHDGRHRSTIPVFSLVTSCIKSEICQTQWAAITQSSGAEQSASYLHICSLLPLHMPLKSHWTFLERIMIEEKLYMRVQKKEKREEISREKSSSYWNNQPWRKKEQLMWKKLGYHGNFVNTKKTNNSNNNLLARGTGLASSCHNTQPKVP